MKSKAPLLLMEQMVMLLVFALAAALCLQAFVKSDAVSRRSGDRDRAVVLCQSAAEAIRHTGDVEEGLELARQGKMYMELLEEYAQIMETFTAQTVGKTELSAGKAGLITE